MNPELNMIFQRRSIRAYKPGEITDHMIQDLLEAAMAAPSACAKDPWHFIVIKDKTVLQALTAGLPNGTMLAEAALGIAVCGNQSEAHDNQLSYMLQDVSAAVQNILIAASTLGLGAVWLGVHPREERIKHCHEILNIPQNITPVAVISIGWPGEQKKARTRFDRAKVRQEKWQN